MSGQKLKFMPIDPSSAPEKRRMRNTEKSNSGSTARRCAAAKMMKPPAAAQAGQRGQAGKARHRPCVMNQARPNTATESETMPAQSSRRCCGSRDSSTPAAAAEGRHRDGNMHRNTLCQLDSATMPAPMIGPRPRPMPKTTPQAPKAWRARRCRRTGATAPPAGRPAWRRRPCPEGSGPRSAGGTACRPQAEGGEAEQHRQSRNARLRP